MSKTNNTFIYLATYPNEAAAQTDYQAVKDLHAGGLVGSYDAAIVTKDADGKVHANKDETATRHGAWWGVAAGAALGAIFPPSILGSAAVGGAIGGVSGHLAKGMSRSDVKELGDALDAGQAALIVVGETRSPTRSRRPSCKAIKQVKKQIDADADELKRELDEAAKEV